MFTGIVEEVGIMRRMDREGGGVTLVVDCTLAVAGAAVGDSISVNGCCLTVTTLPDQGGFTADLMGETLDRTSLGALADGSRVNLERAVRVGDRLGGHIVQGHVDGVGTVRTVEPHAEWTVLRVDPPGHLRRYVVEKGSITVDGVSLTVMEADDDGFAVGLIPHTLAATSLSDRQPGDQVNLEGDVVAKYVERLIRPWNTETA